MKLKKLLKEIPVKDVKGSKEIEITGVCSNSKLVAPGNLFVARKGRAENGAYYIPEAIAAGAVAVLSDIYDPSLKNVTQIIDSAVGEKEALFAAHYYQFPSDELFMVGITGTNGKTTTSFLIKHLLDQFAGPCGVIGTIEYIIGEHHYQANRTTPDVTTNYKMLREMVMHDCQSAVMEVTSHALDQKRISFIDFDVAIFTNLSLDHLDYHKTMEEYCKAKNLLFRSLSPSLKKHKKEKLAVINVDDAWHHSMVEGCRVKKLTYGIENKADLQATEVVLTPRGTQFQLKYLDKSLECHTPLVGRFNVYNCLAAIAVGLAQQIPVEKVVKLLSTFPPVPGRLEVVPNALDLKIYVDFAHTDDALRNVFECLLEFKKGKIITVFGCGGDRDPTKRPKMAAVCARFSDINIVTSDNPRSEDPLEICQQVVKGFNNQQNYHIEVDRRLAIEAAINLATPDDIILIAGKGHETYQVFAHQTIEFDDRKVAQQICLNKLTF